MNETEGGRLVGAAGASRRQYGQVAHVMGLASWTRDYMTETEGAGLWVRLMKADDNIDRRHS